MQIESWCTLSGNEEVYDEIVALKNEKLQKKIYRDLKIVAGQESLISCLRIGIIRSITGSHPQLYEIKIKDVRIMFCMNKGICWLLTLFIKQGQKTPLHEIRKAENRAKSTIS